MKKLSRKQKNRFYTLMLLLAILIVFTGFILLINYHEEGSLTSTLKLGMDKAKWLNFHISVNILILFGIIFHISDKLPWIERTNPLKKKIENRKVWRKFYSDLLMLTVLSISLLSGFASYLLDPKVYAVLDVHAKSGVILSMLILSHLVFRRKRFKFLIGRDPKLRN